jgi:hypothetical protein
MIDRVLTADSYNEGTANQNLLNPERAIAAILIKFYNDWGNLRDATLDVINYCDDRRELLDSHTQSYGEPTPSPKYNFTTPSFYQYPG